MPISPVMDTDPSDAEFSKSLLSDLAQVSPEIADQSRKNFTTILHFINNATATAIAERMGMHESSISRAKSGGQLNYCARLLAAAGLKVVPFDAIVYLQPDEYR